MACEVSLIALWLCPDLGLSEWIRTPNIPNLHLGYLGHMNNTSMYPKFFQYVLAETQALKGWGDTTKVGL
jgi:hypothetical protein